MLLLASYTDAKAFHINQLEPRSPASLVPQDIQLVSSKSSAGVKLAESYAGCRF